MCTVWVSKRCEPTSGTLLLLTDGVTADVISVVSLYSDDCDDGVSADTVEQCMVSLCH